MCCFIACSQFSFSQTANTLPPTGNVGVGTTAVTGYKLSVEGIIRARRMLVNNTWADYVFETNYQLMPLADLETYITTKKHLPNVPTAQEVEKKWS